MGGDRSPVPREKRPAVSIRKFRSEDAWFCFRVRSHAFIVDFFKELGSHHVATGVAAYMPADYVRMAEDAEFFVVEDAGAPVGFFTLKKVNERRAEVPLIYLTASARGRSLGRQCISHAEEWIKSNWPGVSILFLDTVVPEYNGGFYEKVGFKPVGNTECTFPDGWVPAVRFEKRLHS